MRFLHLADLHLGKRHDAVELGADQRDVLEQITDVADRERVDAVLICGDVYDRSVPPADAVALLDSFLTTLAAKRPVLLIAGNHDSAQRLSFAGTLLEKQNVYMAGDLRHALAPLTLGDTDFYLLPYLHPAQVKEQLGVDVHTMDEAVRAVLTQAACHPDHHKVLLAHLFATASGHLPERSDSEISPVGGLDDVDVSAFDGFDYVALGHIHGPQRIGRDTIRYAGSPLPYSFSEAHHHKSVAVVDIGDTVQVRLCPLRPLHAMKEVRGRLEELLQAHPCEDFVHAVLTDETPQLNAKARLENVYPNILRVTYALPPARVHNIPLAALTGAEKKDDLTLFADFFAEKCRRPMDEAEQQVIVQMLNAGREQP